MIHFRTWIVQIGISIWFQIFIPLNETAFRLQDRAHSLINMVGQGYFGQKLFTLLLCSMLLKDCSTLNSSSPVTPHP